MLSFNGTDPNPGHTTFFNRTNMILLGVGLVMLGGLVGRCLKKWFVNRYETSPNLPTDREVQIVWRVIRTNADPSEQRPAQATLSSTSATYAPAYENRNAELESPDSPTTPLLSEESKERPAAQIIGAI